MALKKPVVPAVKMSQPQASQEAPAEAVAADTTIPYVEPEEQEASTAVATVAQPTQPTQAIAPAAGRSIAAAENSDGFEGLDDKIGFGSFTIVKLDKDKFILSAEEEVEKFDAILRQSRTKYLYKIDDDHLAYSYDGERTQNGTPLSEVFAEWTDELGKDCSDPAVSEYMEVVAEICDESVSLNGELVLLSVPPASVNRLGGYRAKLKLVQRRRLDQVVTTVCSQPKVTLKNKKTFHPWDFRFKRLRTKEELETEAAV